MFKQRLISSLNFVPVSLLAFYFGGIPLLVFLTFCLGLGAYEYAQILHKADLKVAVWLVIVGVLVLLGLRHFFGFQFAALSISILLLGLAGHALFQFEKGNDKAYQQFALELSGVLYLGWLGAYSVSVRNLANGRWWSLVAVGLVMLVDLGAYIVGSLIGKHHFAPRLSPSKTWEGLAGGLLFGAGFGALIGWLGAPLLPELGVWRGLVLGALIAVISPFGDIFLSMLKRGAGVKDAGKLLPGIGGIMDRIDSWIWGMTVAYYFVLLIAR